MLSEGPTALGTEMKISEGKFLVSENPGALKNLMLPCPASAEMEFTLADRGINFFLKIILIF
jgi:hypothetical protein